MVKQRRSSQIGPRVARRGQKEVLGLWLAENKDAKFLLSVLIEVRQRGVHDIYIASMDGLEGLPEAVNVVFPKTLTQLCIVHLVRASFRYVSRRGCKVVGAALTRIYRSVSAEEALAEQYAFEVEWGAKYRSV